MRTILVISKREITRLTTRFRGRSLAAVLALVILTIIGSYIIYHQDLAISKNMYNVGVSADTPTIYDSRFNVIPMERVAGYRGVQDGTIDVYLDSDNIVSGGAERSEYAAGALAQYLQKQDLLRIAGEYEIDQAFPLRIEIGYLDTEWASSAAPSVTPETTSPGVIPPLTPPGTPTPTPTEIRKSVV